MSRFITDPLVHTRAITLVMRKGKAGKAGLSHFDFSKATNYWQ